MATTTQVTTTASPTSQGELLRLDMTTTKRLQSFLDKKPDDDNGGTVMIPWNLFHADHVVSDKSAKEVWKRFLTDLSFEHTKLFIKKVINEKRAVCPFPVLY